MSKFTTTSELIALLQKEDPQGTQMVVFDKHNVVTDVSSVCGRVELQSDQKLR